MRVVYNFDREWKFFRGEPETDTLKSHVAACSACKTGGTLGAAGRIYDDSVWAGVDLPHDYKLSSTYSADNSLSGGYLDSENGWYRKTFCLDEKYKGKQILICFEGTAVHAEFYVNGSLVSRSFSAYTETVIDITDYVNFGKFATNVIAVHIDGKSSEGWWYEGAGIYRHVKLYVKEAVHIGHNGVFVRSNKVDDRRWKTLVSVEVENSGYSDADTKIEAELFRGDKLIAKSQLLSVKLQPCAKIEKQLSFEVNSPDLWDVDSPNLYRVSVSVYSDGLKTDEDNVTTGFRTFSVSPENGFMLNGRPLKIKGICCHQTYGGVGVALPDSVQDYCATLVKSMGANTYRCAHNPPASALLDACDRLGLIVIDENRSFEECDNLKNIESFVKRDRNHPSVIFWSLFNEEPLQNTEMGANIYKRLKAFVRSLDDTRLFTCAINGNMDGAGQETDITGINYAIANIPGFHKKYPLQPVFGSENASVVSTRGCYKTDNEAHQLKGYDEECVPWGQTVRQSWNFALQHEWFAGIALWTGFDYQGEPTPYKWPSVTSQFGLMDLCGIPKDGYYYAKACYSVKPTLKIIPESWNFKVGEKVRIAVPTNCSQTELFVNGISYGKKQSGCINTPEWQVDFEQGQVVAVGYDEKGNILCKDTVKTAGKAKQIKIVCPRSYIADDGQDTVEVIVSLVDSEGTDIPYSDDLIEFISQGNLFVRGVGNGNPNSHESETDNKRRLFNGKCMALVSANKGEEAVLKVQCKGLPDATVKFTLVHHEGLPQLNAAPNVTISDFTMSDIYNERPDPLVKIADNDFNSFIPINVVGSHQNDFHSGYRIYRTFITAPKGNKFEMNLINYVADETEVYISGKCVYSEKNSTGGEKSANFSVELRAGERAEVRILLFNRDAPYGGIRDGIKIVAE